MTRCRNTVGEAGVLAIRVQPNHPADDIGGILLSAFEGLLYGKLAVSIPDAVVVARLAWQVERDQAIPERDAALRQLEKWQQDMTEFTWAVRMVLDRHYPGAWPAVMAEIRKQKR